MNHFEPIFLVNPIPRTRFRWCSKVTPIKSALVPESVIFPKPWTFSKKNNRICIFIYWYTYVIQTLISILFFSLYYLC